ncbi:MAG: hypothetical protein K0R24_550 [Gammaproteobacteria bacterium]|jgi:hypothetical protein|nr:hypothetical protein [Gammaproteobacteria bacterium]
MTLKRIPIFTIGLLYGALVNSAVLGICYGLWAASVAIRVIVQGLLRSPLLDCGSEPQGCFAFCTVLGILIGTAATIGFVGGVLYGLVTGSWHCAMDFYNNGFIRGLSSPFRFLSALWNYKINNNYTELRTYYSSTNINLLAKKQKAEKRVLDRAKLIHVLMNKRNGEMFPGSGCPKGISHLVVRFAGSSDLELSGNSTIRNIARTIETQVLPLSADDESVADEKDSFLSPQSDNKITVAKFLTQAEISSLIQGFFKEDSIPHPHLHRQPPPRAKESCLGLH